MPRFLMVLFGVMVFVYRIGVPSTVRRGECDEIEE